MPKVYGLENGKNEGHDEFIPSKELAENMGFKEELRIGLQLGQPSPAQPSHSVIVAVVVW